jgi:hypothetical protein
MLQRFGPNPRNKQALMAITDDLRRVTFQGMLPTNMTCADSVTLGSILPLLFGLTWALRTLHTNPATCTLRACLPEYHVWSAVVFSCLFILCVVCIKCLAHPARGTSAKVA